MRPMRGMTVRGFPASVDGRGAADTAQSVIHWFRRNKNTIHRGTLNLSAGELVFTNGEPAGAFEIDMTSIMDGS